MAIVRNSALRWPELGGKPHISTLWLGFGALVLIMLVLAWWLGGQAGRSQAIVDLREAGRNGLSLHLNALQSELEKQRAVPLILASDPDIAAIVTGQGDAARLDAIDRKLEGLSRSIRAAVIYVIDRDGLTVAASNWQTETSFVGSNYAFRPYFQDALRNGTADHFALGSVSGEPGYYLARRIDGAAGPLGVVVVKVEFDAIENEWRGLRERSFVTDERGIVLITSIDAWRFLTLRPLPVAERALIQATRQFGYAPLSPLPFDLADSAEGGLIAMPPAEGRRPERFLHLEAAIPTTRWTMHLMMPTGDAIERQQAALRAYAALAVLLAAALAAMALHRINRGRAWSALQDRLRTALEHEVGVRTRELEATNLRLHDEIEDRRRAAAQLAQMQDELVQANKLAILGQITASVAHEINQPVAAIRTYADNARILGERGRDADVRANLEIIVGLTERVGAITQALRGFARKSHGRVEPVRCDEAIDGALRLVGHRVRRRGVRLVRDAPAEPVLVMADRLRLEQVLVNLLQNALDALEGREEPMIHLALEPDGDTVVLSVEDNGPGLPPEVVERLFIPFVTTKAEGVGLGLVISQDIVREFGGELEGGAARSGGARFAIRLRRAAP